MKNISILLVLMLFALSATSVKAQENNDSTAIVEVKKKRPAKEKSKQNFTFIYAVHDGKDATVKLVTKIKDTYERAVRQGDRCIIYVPNQRTPLLVQVNTETTDTIDSDVALDNMIGELNNRLSFNMNNKFDIEKILELFTENEIIGKDGNLAYRSVVFDLYITSKFWERGYNEKMIPALYFALDIDRLYNVALQDITMSVYYNESEDVVEYVAVPYGIKNYNKINNAQFMIPMEY